ncbi:hypothetical protein L3X38_032778 [Prunus dulcis]|uniref:Uncharacterized protein n=1 Tax=Prunus dulcis TaxID=3755 RepID=A0AAD4YW78_PRUDU|nr:hypothetical protein L3X38_032778 [Prunus dulcis]
MDAKGDTKLACCKAMWLGTGGVEGKKGVAKGAEGKNAMGWAGPYGAGPGLGFGNGRDLPCRLARVIEEVLDKRLLRLKKRAFSGGCQPVRVFSLRWSVLGGASAGKGPTNHRLLAKEFVSPFCSAQPLPFGKGALIKFLQAPCVRQGEFCDSPISSARLANSAGALGLEVEGGIGLGSASNSCVVSAILAPDLPFGKIGLDFGLDFVVSSPYYFSTRPAVRQHTFGRFGVAVVSGLASARRRIGAVIFREPSSNLSTALAFQQGWLVINLLHLVTLATDHGCGRGRYQNDRGDVLFLPQPPPAADSPKSGDEAADVVQTSKQSISLLRPPIPSTQAPKTRQTRRRDLQELCRCLPTSSLPSVLSVHLTFASRVSGTPGPWVPGFAARIDLVSRDLPGFAARIDCVSPRPARIADQADYGPLNPASCGLG